MLTFWRHAIQILIISVVRPYVIRELPGWGKLTPCIDYRFDWIWIGAPVKLIREKIHGSLIRLDLSTWADRSYYFLGRWYDLEMQLLLSGTIISGDTVVDVGANRGAFALAASHVVGDGKVICFEPNPNCVKLLEELITLNQISNITLHRCGLADKEDILTLTVPLINSGEGSFRDSRYQDNLTFQVPVRRGDDVLANETPTLVKIDVEGFETKVIVGISKTIERCLPVVITEVVQNHLEQAGSSVERLTSAMKGLGYTPFRLSLRKSDRGYDWRLIKFEPSGGDCDVVWLNTGVTRHRLISEQRI